MSRVARMSILLTLFAAAGTLAWADYPTEFERWSAFGEGTSITIESVSEMGGKKVTTQMTQTLKKKEADKVTLSMDVQVMGKKQTQERVITKDQAKQECPLCHKVHKAPEIKEGSKEKVKIGDKEYDTTILDITAYTCNDKVSKLKVWRCDDLPGMTARTEMITSMGGKMTMTVTAFEKK